MSSFWGNVLMDKVFVLLDGDRLKNLIAYLKKLPLDGSLQVKISKKARSNEQNSALWGVAYPAIMNEVGLHGKDEAVILHNQFCGAFWGWEMLTFMGNTIRKPERTTTIDKYGKRDVIDKDEFIKFYQFIQVKSAEFGIFVPDPDPYFKTNKGE